jgi:hypothetical protein
MDMRRSGVVGAIASGTDAVGLSDALWQGQEVMWAAGLRDEVIFASFRHGSLRSRRDAARELIAAFLTDGRRSAKGMAQCGCSSMVEQQPSKLMTRVRFPSPAPMISMG